MVHPEASHSKVQTFRPPQKKNGHVERVHGREDKNLKQEQTTDTLLMVSPSNFKFNEETAKSNVFQKEVKISNDTALIEFNAAVDTLREHNVRVIVMPSRENVETPDSVFPDWFSVHTTDKLRGRVLVLYPMFTESRRLELQPENLIKHLKKEGIEINEIIDLSPYADAPMFLEGKGSLVLDRENKIIYAAMSERTDPRMVNIFAEKMKYTPIFFHSFDDNGQLIYHTDVVLSIGSKFAVVALDTISCKTERATILKQLKASGREIIPVTIEQIKNMAGNMIEVKSTCGKPKIVMSCQAYKTYTPEQRKTFSKYGEIIALDITNIETVGGGSCHCMLTEVF